MEVFKINRKIMLPFGIMPEGAVVKAHKTEIVDGTFIPGKGTPFVILIETWGNQEAAEHSVDTQGRPQTSPLSMVVPHKNIISGFIPAESKSVGFADLFNGAIKAHLSHFYGEYVEMITIADPMPPEPPELPEMEPLP